MNNIINNINNQITDNNKLGQVRAMEYTGSLSPSTKKAYISDIKQFFGVKDLSDITIEQIKNTTVATANQFRESLMAKGYKVATINRKLTSLKSFFKMTSSRMVNLTEYNPFDSSEGNKRVRNEVNYSTTRCLTMEEVQSMIRVVKYNHNDIITIRDCLVVSLLATSGLRREEIANIRLGDFKTTQGKVLVTIVGKGQKQREIMVSGIIMEVINDYLALRHVTFKNSNKYLIANHSSNAISDETPVSHVTISRIVKKIAIKAGLSNPQTVSPHSFRHTFITESLRSGCSLEDVQDLAGHSSSTTTRRYDRINRIIEHNPCEKLTSMMFE